MKDDVVAVRMKGTKVNPASNRNIFKRFRFRNGTSSSNNKPGRNEATTAPEMEAISISANEEQQPISTTKRTPGAASKDELENFIDERSKENSTSGCMKLVRLKSDKKNDKSMKELEAMMKPSPPLPMVKFDSEGDFSKEPIDSKNYFILSYLLTRVLYFLFVLI